MKICMVNGGVFGSTGRIMFGIAEQARAAGMQVLCASPVTSTNRNKEPKESYYRIGSYRSRQFSVLFARLTGLSGCFAPIATWKFLRELDRFQPDIVHLHTLHESYINLPMLFRYLSRKKIRTICTLHDCWSFTGRCPHFVQYGCEKWKTQCHHCPHKNAYPISYLDNSKTMHRLKKKWFSKVQDLTIVTPSQWLADLVKQSFLKDRPVKVIHNGIDLSIFKPTESDFRERYSCQDKKIVLGVAFGWSNKKGLDVFCDLANRLDESYQIVLVGTDDAVDKLLPPNIISIHRTQDQKELAKVYSAADVFVNPTREDTFPTVNMEAIACGTPVVTFNTGGSPETIDDTCGIVLKNEDTLSIAKAIESICTGSVYSQIVCLAAAERYEYQKNLRAYFSVF